MFLLLLAASASPPAMGTASARISIRILHAARATERDWQSAKRRSDRLLVDDKGLKMRVRTIDFE